MQYTAQPAPFILPLFTPFNARPSDVEKTLRESRVSCCIKFPTPCPEQEFLKNLNHVFLLVLLTWKDFKHFGAVAFATQNAINACTCVSDTAGALFSFFHFCDFSRRLECLNKTRAEKGARLAACTQHFQLRTQLHWCEHLLPPH